MEWIVRKRQYKPEKHIAYHGEYFLKVTCINKKFWEWIVYRGDKLIGSSSLDTRPWTTSSVIARERAEECVNKNAYVTVRS
jgi:hypothetical protein